MHEDVNKQTRIHSEIGFLYWTPFTIDEVKCMRGDNNLSGHRQKKSRVKV